jgi:nucleoid DNA-binding protein
MTMIPPVKKEEEVRDRDAAAFRDRVSSLIVTEWGLTSGPIPKGKHRPDEELRSSTSFVELVLREITDCLERGETVELSSFGSFVVHKKGQRIGRNPKTSKQVPISPRRVMVFKPSAVLRQRIQSQEGIEPPATKPKTARKILQSEQYDVAKLGGSKAHIVVVPTDDSLGRTVSRIVERVPEIFRIRRQELTERNIDALVELYLNDDSISEARIAIETDNARERARFLTEVACLTSRQVAENAGHQAANASVTGSRWKQQGKIFSVPSKGSELFPAFQFRDGQPHPTVAKILCELPKQMSPWQIAFWFTSSNSWLKGATPADRLNDEAQVVTAARRENEPLIG